MISDKSIILKFSVTFILLLPIIIKGQEVSTKSQREGWAIHLGAGTMYGGNIGFLTERQILIKEKLRISPFLSIGVGEAGTDSITAKKHYWLGYAAGANFEYGKKHRIILGPNFEGNSLIGNSDRVRKNFFGGFSFILGYKGTSDFGLIWQVYIGNFYSPDDDPFSANTKYEHRSHAGIGIGYKF
jgi:hypothetical protein